MTTIFLSIHGSYNQLQIALFEQTKCLQTVVYNDVRASSFLIPCMDNLLKDNAKRLQDLDFIAVDEGPGAFTSLRVTIATINGIGFATNLPLIGVNGLQALCSEVSDSFGEKNDTGVTHVVSLLNAYGNDVYFLIKDFDGRDQIGCENIDTLLDNLKKRFSEKVLLFTGNAVSIHRLLIKEAFGDNATIQDPLQLVPSARYIGMLGYRVWCENKGCNRIFPNYLKTQVFATKK